jgi:HK97 family phage prohead protease
LSETLEQAQDTETAERPFLIREFVAADLAVEGRTVDVRLVPFGEVARVADPPAWDPYDEEWMPGVFDHQLTAASRIHAKYGHSRSVLDVVGHGIELRAERDGYHVATKIHQTPQGDTTLELLRDGALPCVSLEANPVRNRRTRAGVIQRVKANLTGFAFCRQGAFAGAQVLAIREAPEITVDEELLPVEMDPERVERLRAQGIVLPDRYTKAHPANTDTPAEAGTSDDGTRHTEATTSSKE